MDFWAYGRHYKMYIFIHHANLWNSAWMVHFMARTKATSTYWTRHTHWDTKHRLPQMLPPQDECITEIWQQWILTPFEDHITVSQDLSQDPQVNTIEISFDLHFPNITQERTNTPLHPVCTTCARFHTG